jgi:hypothetical protein
MNLANAMPAVYSAIDSKKFEQIAQVRSINRIGPANGANVYFEFGLAADPLPLQAAALLANAPLRASLVPPGREENRSADALVLVSGAKSKRASSALAPNVCDRGQEHMGESCMRRSSGRAALRRSERHRFARSVIAVSVLILRACRGAYLPAPFKHR